MYVGDSPDGVSEVSYRIQSASGEGRRLESQMSHQIQEGSGGRSRRESSKGERETRRRQKSSKIHGNERDSSREESRRESESESEWKTGAPLKW
jgi:hypothetical protein